MTAAGLALPGPADLPGDLGPVVGIGVDAVEIERLRSVLARRPAVLGRVYTDAELAYAHRAADPVPRLATRFAAKEAVMKALGVGLGGIGLREVEVVREGLDAPVLRLHGTAVRRSADAGIVRWHLSLTHTDRVAVAFVVAGAGDGTGTTAPAGASGSPPRPSPSS